MFQSRAEDLQLFMSQVFFFLFLCVCIHINHPRRCTSSTRRCVQPRLHQLAFQVHIFPPSESERVLPASGAAWRTRGDPLGDA